MNYDSPLVVSSVENSEIVDYFEVKHIFKGTKKFDAARVLVNARFNELSELYKPLKSHKKRTMKYREKLGEQLKSINDKMTTL
jgi:hypothetical protein